MVELTVGLLNVEHPGNLGAVARAMKNFSCENLLLIEPKCRIDDLDAQKRAKWANDVLEKAQQASIEILESFVSQCPRSVGEIASGIPLAQSTVSEHLRLLRKADLLHTLRGAQTWHCLNRSVLRGFIERASRLAAR